MRRINTKIEKYNKQFPLVVFLLKFFVVIQTLKKNISNTVALGKKIYFKWSKEVGQLHEGVNSELNNHQNDVPSPNARSLYL